MSSEAASWGVGNTRYNEYSQIKTLRDSDSIGAVKTASMTLHTSGVLVQILADQATPPSDCCSRQMELSFRIRVAYTLSNITRSALNLEFQTISFPGTAVFR